MKLSEVKGIQLTPVDPAKTPPDPNVTVNHLRNYNMWAASPHSKALSLVVNNERASADCYGCHSAEGFAAKLIGKKVDISKRRLSTRYHASCATIRTIVRIRANWSWPLKSSAFPVIARKPH